MSFPKRKNSSPAAFLEPKNNQRLEAVVMEIFSNEDFHKANMRTIAKRAGVSFSTIYKYYGSKENLLFAFVDKKLKILTERMVDHLQGIDNLKDKLRKVFWLQMDYYERNPELGRIIFMTVPMITWMKDKTFKQKKLIGIWLETLQQGQKEGLLNPKVRAEDLLDFYYGLVQRSFFMWIYRGQSESLSGKAPQLFEMVWRALSNPDTEIDLTVLY
jgi:AcrR family transcriptional regulator